MATIYGSNYSEIIDGTSNSDVIYAYGGNDDVYGYGGFDSLYGGAGNDVLDGGSGDDDLYGGTGVNDLYGGFGNDWFIMSTRGVGGSDDWIGDFEFDFDKIDVSDWGISDFSQIQALLQTDASGSAWFNAGYNGYSHYLTIDNVLAGELISSDFIYSQSGSTNQTGTAYSDTLFGSRYADIIRGAGGSDVLLGGFGADALIGMVGNDRLIGGAGNDILIGGENTDTLTGNAGNDLFDFNAITESRVGAGDRIVDFQKGFDRIDVSGIDANNNIAGNQAFAWIGNANFTAAGQLHYAYSGGNTIISGNVGGTLAADFEIVIAKLITPVAADFVL